MKKSILGLVFIMAIGSVASARKVTINCYTPDNKERINLTAVIDHGNLERADMEVISTVYYPDQVGASSGAMVSRAQVQNGEPWYGANDSIGRFHFGLWVPNELMFGDQTDMPHQVYKGFTSTNGIPQQVLCSNSFED